ncbi:tetratricopeptide repeat protein [Algoriphagus oliviformis]|nr:tetratricopeptide repeat protein [Algoriphagus oliviformis]
MANYSGLNFVWILVNGSQSTIHSHWESNNMMSFEKGIALYQEGKFEEALEIFNQLISSKTGESSLHLYRARILTRLGKGEAALQDFDLLLSQKPYQTDYISDRAVVLHLLGRNDEALAELDRAANLDPKNPYRYSSRAFFKDRIGDLHGAIEDYDKAIELDPEDAVAYNNKGLVEEKLGFKERSKKSFEKSDELIGYDPEKSANDLPSIGSKKSAETPQPGPIREQAPKQMSSGHFWSTLKSLLLDSKTRREFGRFLGDFFSGKKSKNA